MNNKVHISYKWTEPGKGIVRNWLFSSLKNSNLLGVLDIHNCCFMDSIMRFEQEIGQAELVIIVICQEYIKSQACLYEATSIVTNPNYRKRVVLINLDETRLSDKDYSQIVNNYQVKLAKAESDKNAMLPPANKYYDSSIEQYKTILNGIADFADLLRDSNSLNFTDLSKEDFKILIDKIQELQGFQEIIE